MKQDGNPGKIKPWIRLSFLTMTARRRIHGFCDETVRQGVDVVPPP